ncbi:MAG: 50S ribosomal protein L32 [Elusimicrobiota bacterium]
MPNPKRKHTRSRRDKRKYQSWKLELTNLSVCPNCGALKKPHIVCPSCGYYKGKIVISKKDKSKENKENK